MATISETEPQDQPRERVEWLTDALLVVMLSIAAAWWRFEVYREHGLIQPLLLPQHWTLLWILAADMSLIALIPAAIAAGLCALKRPRIAAAVLLVGIWVAMVWTAADMRVHVVTGKHLTYYLPYLSQPDVGEWAGGTDELVRAGAILAGVCALVTAGIGLYRYGLLRALTRWPPRRRTVGWLLAIALLTGLLGGRAYMPVATAGGDALSKALIAMQASAEAAMENSIATSEFGLAFSKAMQPILEELHADLFTPRPLPAVPPLEHDDRPDVVILILESWRWDSLNPTDMPRLYALSQRGLVGRRHYAASNRSEYGLFSLFYGRSPALYDATLDRSIPPTVCHVLRQWGYASVYVSGLRHAQFQRMEQYIDHPESFDEVIMLTDKEWFQELYAPTWPDRDRRALGYLASRLGQGDRKPTLAVAFLGATHFPYRYPEEFLRKTPVVPDADVWAGGMNRQTHEQLLRNRYANAASFLDHEIARLIDGLDLSRTIVVVTGDHGESIWDDGVLAHGTRPSEIQCRTPLILLGPNIPQQQIDVPTGHVDVLPTLLNAIAGKPVLDWSEGVDLARIAPDPRPVLLSFQPPRPGPQEIGLILPEGRILVRLMDRKPVARFLGFFDEDGAVDMMLSPPADQAEIWAQRLREALRQRLP